MCGGATFARNTLKKKKKKRKDLRFEVGLPGTTAHIPHRNTDLNSITIKLVYKQEKLSVRSTPESGLKKGRYGIAFGLTVVQMLLANVSQISKYLYKLRCSSGFNGATRFSNTLAKKLYSQLL